MASRQQYTLEFLLGAKTSPGFSGNINKAKSSISGISSTAKKAAGVITAAFAGINIADGIKDAIDTYSGWEQELTNSAAIANASATEYEQMAQASREAGKATTKTAEESASALGYMALAGWDVNESTSALMPVLKLSESTNLDLARTSDLVTDSMSALKLSVKDMPEYLDMVTKAQNSSNQTSEQLMEGYIKAGGAVRALGVDAQDSAVMLGILADNGTKGAEGGRSVNAMLTRMASNDNAIKTFKKLKISIFDSKGEFVGMEKALKRINKGLAGLNQEDRTVALKNIAGTQYFSKMNYLLDGVKEGADGAESAWDKLDRKLDDSEGTLDEMDEKITGTTSGSLQKMNSALDDMKISFVDAFDGEFAAIIDDFASLFNDASDAITDFAEDNEAAIHQTFEGITDSVKSAAGMVASAGEVIIDNFDLIKGVALSVGTAMGTFKAIKGVNNTVNTLSMMAQAVSGIGLSGGLAVGGIALAAGAIAGIGYAVHTSKKKMVQASLEKHFGNISLSLEQIDDVAQQIVGKKKLTQITEMLEAMGETDTAIDNMKSSLRDSQMISWKIKAGLKIDSDDTDAYANSIKSYVKSAQDVIDKRGYTVSVATRLLFGKNSQMESDNDAFYAGLDAEMSRLQKKINKKINKAVKDGVSIEKDEAIQKLLKQVSDITTAVTDAENDAEFDMLTGKYAGLSGADLTPDTMKQLSGDLAKYTEKANEGADEAKKSSLININAQKNMGKISQSEWEEKRQEIDTAYYETKAKSIKKSSDFLIKSITDAYPEIKTAMNGLDKNINQGLKEAMDQGVSGNELKSVLEKIVDETFDETNLSETKRGVITQYFKNGLGSIWSEMDSLQDDMEKNNVKPSKSFKEGMNDMTALSAISGSEQDMMAIVGNTISDNEQWAAIIKTYQDAGVQLPEGLADGIRENTPIVTEAADYMLSNLKSLEGTLQIRVTPQMTEAAFSSLNNPMTVGRQKDAADSVLGKLHKNGASSSGSKPAPKKKPASKGKKKLHKNARGGIYDNPILTTFAESGPEAAIPLDGSARAKALWHNAGQILGMEPTEDRTMYSMPKSVSSDKAMYQGLRSITANRQNVTEGANVQITYAPVIEVKGNADEQVITKVTDMSQAKFAEMMEKYLRNKKRVSFSE